MASKVEIANLALIELGAETIISFTDDTPTAKLINKVYDIILDEVIGSYDWTTATKRANLAQTTTTPKYRYLKEYQLPTNPFCLKILEAYDGSTSNFEWRRENDKLVTDVGSVSIKYLARLTDPVDYGPHLQSALVYRLVSALAYTITGSQNTASSTYERYLSMTREMQSADGAQGSQDVITSVSLTDEVR